MKYLMLIVTCCALTAGCQRNSKSLLTQTPPDKEIILNYAPSTTMLTIAHPLLAKPVQIWCMEAYCKKGSTHRPWDQTTLSQHNTVLSQTAHEIKVRTVIEDRVEAIHRFAVVGGDILFESAFTNLTDVPVDIEWMQPCMRVDQFTGLDQDNYIRSCFIFTEKGLTRLDQTGRTEEAIYKGGQVYVPAGIDLKDVNPRPISPDVPVNNLIGCFSADQKVILATAWDHTQELFQGILVCIHADPAIGGLRPHETKHRRGKLYILPNDTDELLRRYKRDFE